MKLANTAAEKNFLTDAKAWYQAARPKKLTISVIPVAVGTALADVPFDKIRWFLAISALLFAMCVQIGSHYINDALDYINGTDTSEKHNLGMKVINTGKLTTRQVFAGGLLFLIFAFIASLPMIYYGGSVFILIVAASIALAYMYTGGPYPLSYTGIGDAFVMLFYGLIAVCAPAYLQQGFIDWKCLLAGTQIGLIAMSLMSINNLRDLREDRKAHKRTLAVRLGHTFARWQITIQLLLPFFLNYIWYSNGYTLVAALTSMNFPLALNVIRGTWTYDPGKVYNRFMIEIAFVHLMFGVLMILGYVIR